MRDGVRVEAERFDLAARYLVFCVGRRVVQQEFRLSRDGVAFTGREFPRGARRPTRRGGARLSTGSGGAERHVST